MLSVQLLDTDQNAWPSDAARRGDFAGLARERYADATETARLHLLATLLAELQKGHAGDAALMGRLDLTRVAIAGFDVGAYTAMRIAGDCPMRIRNTCTCPCPSGRLLP